MRTTVWIEKLETGYSVCHYGADGKKAPRQFFEEYKDAVNCKDKIRQSLKAKREGIVDPTVRPIDLFHDYLIAIESTHRSTTITMKRGILEKHIAPMSALNYPAIRSFIEHHQKGNKNTAYICCKELRTFCNWALKEGRIQEDPFTYTDANSVKRKLRIPKEEAVGRKLELEEIQRIYAAAPPALRNKLLFFIYTGARRGEVLKAEWSHIDLVNKTWRIPAENSKSGRERIIPLVDVLVDAIKNFPRNGAYIFSRYNTNTTLRAAVRKAGIHDRIRLHDFRHSFASHWDGDPRALMEWLGWNSPAMLRRYTHLRLSDLREKVKSSAIASLAL